MNCLKCMIGLFVLACSTGFASHGIGQENTVDEKKAIEAANNRLVQVLDNTDGLFYKAVKRDDGTMYTVKWEQDGEITRMNLLLELQGTYDSKPIFALFAYAMVAESEKPFPPAVIKMIPVKSDNSRLSSFVMNEKLNAVYVKAALPSDNLTPGQVWMTCVHVHRGRVNLKKDIDKVLSAVSP